MWEGKLMMGERQVYQQLQFSCWVGAVGATPGYRSGKEEAPGEVSATRAIPSFSCAVSYYCR